MNLKTAEGLRDSLTFATNNTISSLFDHLDFIVSNITHLCIHWIEKHVSRGYETHDNFFEVELGQLKVKLVIQLHVVVNKDFLTDLGVFLLCCRLKLVHCKTCDNQCVDRISEHIRVVGKLGIQS